MDALGILTRLGNGHLIDDLAEALAGVAAEVVETGEPGEVTLKLKVANQQAGDVMVVISDQIGRKPPVRKPRGSYLFAVHGELHARDPRQTEMRFTTVDTETGEIHEVGDIQQPIREA